MLIACPTIGTTAVEVETASQITAVKCHKVTFASGCVQCFQYLPRPLEKPQ